MIRIAFDHQIFSVQRYGGISRYYSELIKSMSKTYKNKACIQIAAPIHINKYLETSRVNFPAVGYCLPRIPWATQISKITNKIFTPAILRSWKPNIVHETYYCKSTVAPHCSRIVLTVYDMVHEIFQDTLIYPEATIIAKRKAVKRADHIICISRSTANDLIRILDVNPRKISVIHLGCSTPGQQTSSYPINQKPFILYVGPRNGYKNFKRLLEAYAFISGLKEEFDLICFGGGEFSKLELELFSYHGINNNSIKQLDGPDQLLAKLYSQASIFVYPSLYEGFGLPPLEAMSYECPVICSNTSSMPEVCGDAALFFDPLSSRSISQAINNVLSSKDLQMTLRALGKKRLELFSWESCSKKTFDVYTRLMT